MNLYGAYGENSGIFDVFLALSVYLATMWPCCLDSSICALWKAKDCACIGNSVVEKQARKQGLLAMCWYVGIAASAYSNSLSVVEPVSLSFQFSYCE